MKDKDGFLIYKKQYEPIKCLSDEKLGKLFRAIFEYQLTGIEPQLEPDCLMAFHFFKSQFGIDDQKYQAFVAKQSAKGKKSAEARSTKSTAVNRGKPTQPQSTYKDKVKDKDKDNNKGESVRGDECKQWVDAFNEKQKSKFTAKSLIGNFSYWRDAYSLEDMIKAIDNIPRHEWLKDKATPEILLRRRFSNGEPCDWFGKLLSMPQEISTKYRMKNETN